MCVYVCVRFPCKTLLLAVNRLWSGRVVSLHSLSSPVRCVCVCVLHMCVCVCLVCLSSQSVRFYTDGGPNVQNAVFVVCICEYMCVFQYVHLCVCVSVSIGVSVCVSVSVSVSECECVSVSVIRKGE